MEVEYNQSNGGAQTMIKQVDIDKITITLKNGDELIIHGGSNSFLGMNTRYDILSAVVDVDLFFRINTVPLKEIEDDPG